MDVGKIVIFGGIAGLLSLLLRAYRQDFGIYVALGAATIVAIYLMKSMGDFIHLLGDLGEEIKGVSVYMGILWKALGISYLSEFGAGMCREIGSALLASQIELCGKIAVMLLGIPILVRLLSVIAGYQM